jgi:hypothetical protein
MKRPDHAALREQAIIHSSQTMEAYWVWSMHNARWLRVQRQVSGSVMDLLRHRRMINSARELREFCQRIP